MARFEAAEPNGVAVQQMEGLVRTAIYKPANALVGLLLQEAADRIDAAYLPKPGQHFKGRARLRVDGLFGSFKLDWSPTTTIMKARSRGIIRPMRRWGWKWVARPRWRA
jgi:hypothetical protein